MKPEKLKEIEERHVKATKGPWEAGLGRENNSVFSPAPHQNRAKANMRLFSICYRENEIANVDFIAHSHQDISDLLAEVKELKAKFASERKQHLLVHGLLQKARSHIPPLPA